MKYFWRRTRGSQIGIEIHQRNIILSNEVSILFMYFKDLLLFILNIVWHWSIFQAKRSWFACARESQFDASEKRSKTIARIQSDGHMCVVSIPSIGGVVFQLPVPRSLAATTCERPHVTGMGFFFAIWFVDMEITNKPVDECTSCIVSAWILNAARE